MAEQQQSIGSSTSVLTSGSFRSDASESFTPVLSGTHPQAPLQSTGAADPHLRRRAERSRTLKELQEDAVFGRLWQTPQELPPSQLETASDQRLMILARKYEGAALTREDHARVAILTQRLRRLAPRVTQLSWTLAEESVNRPGIRGGQLV
jgi:hypothetical protein